MRLTTEEGVTLDDTVLRELIFRILDKCVGASAIIIKGGVSITLMSRGIYALYQSTKQQNRSAKVTFWQKIRKIVIQTLHKLFMWAKEKYYYWKGVSLPNTEINDVSTNETVSDLPEQHDENSNDKDFNTQTLTMPSISRTIWSGGIFTLGLVMFASMFSTNTVYRYIEPNQTS